MNAEAPERNPSIFGEAKPRDEKLYEARKRRESEEGGSVRVSESSQN